MSCTLHDSATAINGQLVFTEITNYVVLRLGQGGELSSKLFLVILLRFTSVGMTCG